MGFVICQHCGREMNSKNLARHVKARHDTTYKEYIEKYWETLPGYDKCTICGTICKDSKTCSRECFSKHMSDIGTGRILGPMSEQTKRKLSASARERLKDKTKHHLYGKKHSSESLKRMRQSRLKWYKHNDPPQLGKKHSEETKQKISQTRIERGVAKGENNPMFGKTHTPEAIKKIMQMRPMNKTEKMVADWLDENKIEYTYQFFLSRDGICKSYDFKIKDANLLLEVDGDYWHGGPASEKYNDFAQLDEVKSNDEFKNEFASDNGYVVIRFWESDLKNDISILTDIYKHINETNYG